MSMFTLAISRLTTSNLPWFMDLTFQVPMQYCSLQHWTLLPSPVTFTTGLCFCFGSGFSFWWAAVYGVAQSRIRLKWRSSSSSFILSGAVSPLFSSSILDTFQPKPKRWLIFWCHIFLPFHTLHGVFVERMLSGLPFPPRILHFVRTLHYDLSILGGPTAWLIASLSYASPFTMAR